MQSLKKVVIVIIMNEHIIRRSYNPMRQISSLTSSLGANLVYERNEFGELIASERIKPRAIVFRSISMIRFASGTLALYSYVSDTNDWVDTLGLEGAYAFIVDRVNKVASVGKGKWGRFRKSLRHKMRAYYDGVIKAPNGWASKVLPVKVCKPPPSSFLQQQEPLASPQ